MFNGFVDNIKAAVDAGFMTKEQATEAILIEAKLKAVDKEIATQDHYIYSCTDPNNCKATN